MKPNNPTSYRTPLIFGFLILVLSVAGASMAMRLTSDLEQRDVTLSEIQSSVNQSIRSSEHKFDALANKLSKMIDANSNPGSNDVVDEDSSQFAKQISNQDKLIAYILEQNEQLQTQFEALHRQISSSKDPGLVESDESGAVVGGDSTLTPEALSALVDRQTQEDLRNTEITFQEQVDNTAWSIEAEQTIQSEITGFLERPEFSKLNVDNLDCRESMCKLELNQSADAEPTNFDVELQFALAGRVSSSTVSIQDNGDGSTSKTYYFSK